MRDLFAAMAALRNIVRPVTTREGHEPRLFTQHPRNGKVRGTPIHQIRCGCGLWRSTRSWTRYDVWQQWRRHAGVTL